MRSPVSASMICDIPRVPLSPAGARWGLAGSEAISNSAR